VTTFYTQGARLSGMAAVVCAILAVLAYPGQARADEYVDCYSYCFDIHKGGPGQAKCYGDCVAQLQPGTGCSGNDCSQGCTTSYPDCNKGCKAPGKGPCGSCGCYEAKNLSNECECR